MKVLLIEPCFVGFGGYHRAYAIATALSKKGIGVDLLVSSNKSFTLGIKKTKLNDNFRQYELPRFHRIPIFNGRFTRAILAAFFGIFGRYDIIHACVPAQIESNIPAFLFKIFGKNVVMDWDDFWTGSPIFDEHPRIKKYVVFCEKKSPKFFENIVVVSDLLERKAREWGAKRILKLINGVNTSQFIVHSREESIKKLGLDKDKKYLLAFGNTFDINRAYLLFKTFEKIMGMDPDIYLLFNLDSKKMIEDLKPEKNVNPKCLENVIDVGYIQQEDLGYYLGASDAVIFLQGATENELACFPIRVGSYLNGEAIIAMNDIGSETANTLKKYGCAIIERNPDILARKAADLANDQNWQRQLKEKVRFAKKELSWDRQIESLIRFYRELFEKKD